MPTCLPPSSSPVCAHVYFLMSRLHLVLIPIRRLLPTLAHSGQLSRLLAISLAAIEQHATEEHSLRVTAVTRLATGARYPTGSPSYSWLQAIVSS